MIPAPPSGAFDGLEFVFPVRVYWEDTDAGGVVYHASFIRFQERARTEMVRALGIDQAALLSEDGVAIAVRRLAIDYERPARLGDALHIRSAAISASGARIGLNQAIWRGEQRVASSRVELACLDRAGRAVRLPATLRRALARMLPPETLDA